ncbi:MAG: hypothetical protein AAGF23_20165 [Acidobacteriota bacterium]
MSAIDPSLELPDDEPAECRFVGPAATVAAATQDPPTPPTPPGRLIDVHDYSIRLAAMPGVPGALCQVPTGSGPVGYFEGDPICDHCLDDGCRDLGAVLALIAAARIHAFLVCQKPEQRTAQLEALSGFIDFFERFAGKWGPARVVEMRDVDDETPS